MEFSANYCFISVFASGLIIKKPKEILSQIKLEEVNEYIRNRKCNIQLCELKESFIINKSRFELGKFYGSSGKLGTGKQDIFIVSRIDKPNSGEILFKDENIEKQAIVITEK